MSLTADEINAIAAACAKATEARFEEALRTQLELIMGVNIADEDERREIRKDMEWLRDSRVGISLKEAEADHVWVRRLRLAVERAVWRVGYAVVVAALGGILWLAGIGWRPEILK